MQFTLDDLKKMPIFGIAGNFANHLTQAGEDADFVEIETEDAEAPKGIFPIYIPGHVSFLNCFPLSHDRIQADFSQQVNLQAEPEMCMVFDVTYESGQILELTPRAFSVFNDCSIRRPNAKKISEKKNWGENSTGVCEQWLSCDYLEPHKKLDNYHLASFIKRDGQWFEYGTDSPVKGYQYFYQKLKDWIQKTLNTQQDFGPLENLNSLLRSCHCPEQIVVSFGATRYSEFGEKNYLQPGDEVVICLYSELEYHPEAISTSLESDIGLSKQTLVLKQRVEAV